MSAPPYALDRGGLKARLRSGEVTFGTFLGTAAPVAAEICAASGVDWVLLDLEHGSGGEEQALDVVPAAASYGVPTLVRAESTARIRAGRLLDLGAAGVMFPRIDGPDDAAAAIRHLRYPPDGDRGVATYNRMCRFGLDRAAIDRANAEVLGVVQIETRSAVESVEAIAALDGVDVLFVGPQDLSLRPRRPWRSHRAGLRRRTGPGPARRPGRRQGRRPARPRRRRSRAPRRRGLAVPRRRLRRRAARRRRLDRDARRPPEKGMTEAGRPTVVALGEVDPELVTAHLPEGTTFVAEPTADDLRAASGAIVRADATVDQALLDRMPHLRVLARTGVGVDAVDVDEATRRGIAVVITPGAGTNAVAEGALAMVLHLVKRLRWTTACVAEGRWADRGTRILGDLDGATLGIIGYGRIGRRVAHLAQAFGMTVVAHDPFAKATSELVELAELRRRADVVTLHLPLTDQTTTSWTRRSSTGSSRAPSWSTADAGGCSTSTPPRRDLPTADWAGSASTCSTRSRPAPPAVRP